MPRHFLAQQSIVPEKFFSTVRYSDNHDTTAVWVRDGVVDLGVVNSLALTQMYRSGLLGRETVHVIWETPTYPDYVWVAQPDLPADFSAGARGLPRPVDERARQRCGAGSAPGKGVHAGDRLGFHFSRAGGRGQRFA